MNKALFLDRDGTVIEHVHYLKDPDEVRLVSGCAQALKSARDAGYLLVVISNQSIIGRGTGTHEEVEACNARMEELLSAEGVELDSVLYCPHAPEDECACRKPQPGLLVQAAEALIIDLAQSSMIGDNVTDIEAGRNAGCRANLYLNKREPGTGEHCFDSIVEAIQFALTLG
jgi:D-glycero-D-manno-heptose 1,7-bisphosphate phosphatase